MTALDVAPGARSAGEVLAWSRGVAEPALREAVGCLPASMRRIAGYHLGWWEADGTAIRGEGGKSIRAALVLLSAEAAGGDAGAAVASAVAVELVHNFSLLHDDIMDGDPTRRHRPTAWRVFGVADAMLAGDAMLALAGKVLAGVPAAAERLAECVIELCDGQSADVAFEHRVDVGIDECTAMAGSKTGALLGCACALGGLSAGAEPGAVADFDDFGRQVGLAFQLVDDLLGIWGDPAATGKPVYSDLASRKKSLPVVAALTSGNAAGHELARRYTGDTLAGGDDLPRLAALIDAAGARDWARERADHHLRIATRSLERAARAPRARADLLTLARFITRRDH
ncbi:family 2 encapsulin nanocompartment cargo protein polyprenyl transferase [Pseudonocardia acidicola]|uniref:Polyprenyl synthetase family protein n=1 Tax=Pseudonocardia acidicola TaxID=2724939 RepID=A0ABX1SAX2_9PSEU|nr:family 2 encapsulin nanocompartment cargo protein polyprenyl transferase [Pseudonocardia acidicola]NMH98705.1 polyprenyl synthetase family protein [Pseudonocardia acidicola]